MSTVLLKGTPRHQRQNTGSANSTKSYTEEPFDVDKRRDIPHHVQQVIREDKSGCSSLYQGNEGGSKASEEQASQGY
jgi:hypothetical protein